MTKAKVKALVISGYGINCEKELGLACQLAGADPTIAHARRFLSEEISLDNFQLLLFPGGFSFGDELGAAKVFANKMTYCSALTAFSLKQRLKKFVGDGNAILGICNGFQLLVKLGLLPGSDGNESKQTASLAVNDHGRFENRWVEHQAPSTHCPYTKGLSHLYLPIRHGEGKFIASTPILQSLIQNKQIVLKYAHNPNGSLENIAGVCDPTGRILGMMAHPEAALFFIHHPQWMRIKEQLKRTQQPLPIYDDGFVLFKNIVGHLENHL
jgi:phosphoribosylformylglycinamidine synthase I